VSRLSIVLSAAVLLAVPPAAPAQPAPEVARVRTWLDAHVPEMMRQAGLPGFSIAVVKDGRTVHAAGYGARDPQKNLPATPDTLHGVGSVTKSFVAIAILQLADEGKLKLDDPVSAHVPLELGRPGSPITIRHLLTHSPGFPNLGTSTILISRGLGNDTGIPMSSADDFYRFVNGAKDEVLFAPGERFFYNNAAWRMLGHVVQERSGLPFHRYVKQRILDPLGMSRSTLDVAVAFRDPDRLVPHRRGKNGPEAAPFPYPNPEDNPGFSFLSAAGGILSSANEMARYVSALAGEGRFPGGRLASPTAIAAMQTLQIETDPGHHGTSGYGYGLGVTPGFPGGRLVSHGGSIAVSTAHMAFVPERKVGVVMMGNGPGMAYGRIAENVLALLMGLDPEAVLPAEKIRRRMDRLVGEYHTYRRLETLKVFERDGLLYMGAGEPGTPLVPDDPTYGSLQFRTLSQGLASPVDFLEREDGGLDLVVGRSVFHKAN
jgi:CubicO group peptidase (beta-lactamase class C family)